MMQVREGYGFGRITLLLFGLSIVLMTIILQASDSDVANSTSVIHLPSKPRYHIRFELSHQDIWHLNITGKHKGSNTFTGRGESEEVAVTDDRPAILNALQEDKLDWPHSVRKWGNWEWHRLAKAEKVGAKRILLAQFQGSENGQRMNPHRVFALTKPINLAYAKRWQQDIVFLHQTDDEQSNMAMLLQFAWEHRERYDQVLVLGAEACFVHFEYDVSELLHGQYLVTAKRLEDDGEVHSTQVYGSASIWNVHHLLFPRVEQAWLQRFQSSSRVVQLKELLKPYNTEIYTVNKVIGNTDKANIWVFPPSSASQLKEWTSKTKSLCKKYKLACN